MNFYAGWTTSGIEVTMVAERSGMTDDYDRAYAIALDDYLHAVAENGPASRPPPLTGAEALMDAVQLLRDDGTRPPHSLTKRTGGTGTEWTVVWSAPDWQPAQVVLIGTSEPAYRLAVEE
ncbi:hypothetical protein [Microbacterium sp. 18062]|uniref:hypothetical protein n=1 Tax=Microbacterium sp. 18062 TaxID=2681410 RepID=UPI00135CF397|nr:hypothetical protein [Microbacterium sp. 18062]